MTKDPENPNPPGKRIEVHMQEGLVVAAVESDSAK
jgi:hypothetical protein